MDAEAATPPRRQGNRPPSRSQPARDHAREPGRREAVVVGRDGEELSRRRAVTRDDVYHVPPNEIPKGWTYQWNPVTVLNQEATASLRMMHANGWRPVPADRHPGRWTAPGEKGQIIVDGLRLEERPEALTKEAQLEDFDRAKAQMRDQTDALRLTEKLPQGMSAARKYRGTGADVRMSIDKGLDIPRPEHELES